jgi:hypothetical protein
MFVSFISEKNVTCMQTLDYRSNRELHKPELHVQCSQKPKSLHKYSRFITVGLGQFVYTHTVAFLLQLCHVTFLLHSITVYLTGYLEIKVRLTN